MSLKWQCVLCCEMNRGPTSSPSVLTQPLPKNMAKWIGHAKGSVSWLRACWLALETSCEIKCPSLKFPARSPFAFITVGNQLRHLSWPQLPWRHMKIDVITYRGTIGSTLLLCFHLAPWSQIKAGRQAEQGHVYTGTLHQSSLFTLTAAI